MLKAMGFGAIAYRLRGMTAKIHDARAIIVAIKPTIILQVVFSQWSVMNSLFYTAPLNLNQWLICLLVSLPMILVAALVNRFDPPQLT
jgi:cation-transporting P-type ATPase F